MSTNDAPPVVVPVVVHWLDLRGSGLSIFERLLLEECLLRHDTRNWLIVGTHLATPHRYLSTAATSSSSSTTATPVFGTAWDEEGPTQNRDSAIVLGLGGKPHELLNLDLVQQEGCMCIKRFTGGGTVVLDADSIWTTLLFRPASNHNNNKNDSEQPQPQDLPDLFPRPIMEWTSQRLFAPVFASLRQQEEEEAARAAQSQPKNNSSNNPSTQKTLVLDTKSCAVENTGRVIQVKSGSVEKNHPTATTSTTTTTLMGSAKWEYALRENDYVLGDLKMGGNAQSITKEGWLHHTSFLWDYQDDTMNYLTLPNKRPDYRQDRSHADFLVKLKTAFPHLTKHDFGTTLVTVASQQAGWNVQRQTLRDAMAVVQHVYSAAQGPAQALQQWSEHKSRTRILDDKWQ